MSEPIVITGVGIDRYRLLAIEKGLELQVKTGLGFSGNRCVNAAKQVLESVGIKPKRTHKALLEQFKTYRAKKDAELEKLQNTETPAQPLDQKSYAERHDRWSKEGKQ